MGAVGKRKVGSQKSKKTNKQMLRRAFEGRHIDQIWEDVHNPDKTYQPEARMGPVGTSSRAELDEDTPAFGQFPCVMCSRYLVSQDALDSHQRSKPHKRRLKELQGARPHDQKEADWAAGMGRAYNGDPSASLTSGLIDVQL